MTKQQLVGLGIRVFAILLLVQLIATGSSYLVILLGNEQGSVKYFALLLFGALLIAVLLMIKFPLTVAGKLLPKQGGDDLQWQMTFEELQIAIIMLLGLTVLVSAIPDLTHWLMRGYLLSQSGMRMSGASYAEFIAGLTASLLEVLIGLYLLLGAKTLKNLLYRIRYGRSADR